MPAEQFTDTDVHASWFASLWKDSPRTHDSHCRSVVADGTAATDVPGGHVCHAVHVVASTLLEKVGASQLWHSRSSSVVMARTSTVPGTHGARSPGHVALLGSF